MTMAGDDAPVRPSTETNVLLGRLEAKVDNLTEEQRYSRNEVGSLRTDLAEVKADVAVLKSERGPRTTVWQKAAVIMSIPSSIAAAIALVLVLTK